MGRASCPLAGSCPGSCLSQAMTPKSCSTYFEWPPPWHSSGILYSHAFSCLILPICHIVLTFCLAIFLAFDLAHLWAFFLEYFAGILPGLSSNMFSGVPSSKASRIVSGVLSGISSCILSGILSGISSGILSGISSGILSGGWGPAVPTASGSWKRRRRRRIRALIKL